MTGKLQKVAGRRPKREVILETTVELFRRTHDVRKVSIEDIAATAKVSPTTVYNHFGSRDALVIEAAKALIRNIIDYSSAVLHSDLPFGAKLSTIVSGKLDLASRASSEVISRLMAQDSSIAPYLEEIFTSEVRQLWTEMLRQGKAEGYIDESVDPEAFFIYMDVVRAGFAARTDLFKDWQNNLDLIQKLSMLVFYGFLKKDVDLFGKKESA